MFVELPYDFMKQKNRFVFRTSNYSNFENTVFMSISENEYKIEVKPS